VGEGGWAAGEASEDHASTVRHHRDLLGFVVVKLLLNFCGVCVTRGEGVSVGVGLGRRCARGACKGGERENYLEK